MKNIHVIATDKPSRLWLTKLGNLTRCHDIKPIKEALGNNVNIYITSDEEIKEGDWYLVELFNIEGKSKGLHIEKCTKLDDVWCNNFDVISTRHKNNCKKIILTTDLELQKDNVQDIDDEFLEWFVKNPSCEFIEIMDDWNSPRIDAYEYKIIVPKEDITFEEVFGEEKKKGLKEFIDKQKQKQHLIDMMESDEELGLYDYGWCKGNVVLPKEYPGEYDETQAKQVSQLANNLKQETIEEVAERYYEEHIDQSNIPREHYELEIKELMIGFSNEYQQQNKNLYSEKQMDDAYDKGFKDAIEKMYSEEEVRLMLRELSSDLYEIYPLESLEQWFEQFKNK